MESELATRGAIYVFSAPLIVGIVQWCKKVPKFPPHALPLLAWILGVITAFGAAAAYPLPLQHWFVTLVLGLGLGSTAIGVFSGVRSVFQPMFGVQQQGATPRE